MGHYLKVMFKAILGILLFLLFAYCLWKDRKNIERIHVLFVRRTRKGIWILNELAKIPGLRAFYTLGIPVCVLGSILILLTIVLNSIYILQTPGASPGITPIIPGLRIPGSPLFIPFGYGMLALSILLVVHEGSHGIAARVEKIKVKSTGLLMALILPGAFVEPDEKQFEKARPLTRLRIAAAGSFANILTAVIAILLIGLLLWGIPVRGVMLTAVINGTPAAAAFDGPAIISEVNGVQVSNFMDMYEVLNRTAPNETVAFTIYTEANSTFVEGEKSITMATHPDDPAKGYAGIPYYGVLEPNIRTILFALPLRPIYVVKAISPPFWKLPRSSLLWIPINILKWTAMLNFAIGIVNLLPVAPLDGGIIVNELAKKVSPRAGKIVATVFALLIVALFLINIMPYFL